jgi:hypothetical protein
VSYNPKRSWQSPTRSAWPCGRPASPGRMARPSPNGSICPIGPSVTCSPCSSAKAGLSPPRYRGHPGSDFPADLIHEALAYRDQHPDWGAGLIRVMLGRLGRWQCLPDPRTIQRWLEKVGLAPAPTGRRSPHCPRSSAPHERWQVDAADQLRLGNGQLASWLRMTDECSGTILRTVVFPMVFNAVPPASVREGLRSGFLAWGLPEELRLDNGWPWGGWFDLPTPVALDLAGFGLRLHYNDPRSPRQNSVVERSHKTSQKWVEPHTCADAVELQRRCDEMDEIQRADYPHRGAGSRMRRYPGLAHSGRKYSVEWEQESWSIQTAKAYLASHVGVRQVSEKGQVTVYARKYQLGRVNGGKKALVQYDPLGGEWLFSSPEGVLWCRHDAEQITAERIRDLDLSDVRGKT